MPSSSTSSHGKKMKVLFIPLEFLVWNRARHLSHGFSLGFEDGFRANGIDFTTLPALCADSIAMSGAETRSYWLDKARVLFQGMKFDQVWVEVVHTHLDAGILDWISGLAPVRVALIGESLEYDSETVGLAPHLRQHKSRVEKRLAAFTHCLAADEADAGSLAGRNIVKAMWWASVVSERFIGKVWNPQQQKRGIFAGAPYGDRMAWLEVPSLKPLLAHQGPSHAEDMLASRFDELNSKLAGHLDAGKAATFAQLSLYLEPLRTIRNGMAVNWIRNLANGAATVNLPSFFQGYASRVFEAMAAGNPVISWKVPSRPRTLDLFEDGKEILLFQKEDPARLLGHLERVIADPAFGQRIADNAMRKLWRFHTMEKRIGHVLHWIETGIEPGYRDEAPEPELDKSFAAFSRGFEESPNPATVGAAKPDLQTEMRKAESLLVSGDINGALTLLESISEAFPGQVELHRLLGDLNCKVGSYRKASIEFMQAIQIDNQDVSLWIACAKACIGESNREMAKVALEGALALQPGHAEASALLRDLPGANPTGPGPAKRIPSQQEQDRFYEKFFLQSPEYAVAHSNPEEEVRWQKIEHYLKATRDERLAMGKPPLRILDLGCGRGWLTERASRFGTCEGMEPVAPVIEGARRQHPNLTFYACEAHELRKRPDFRPYDLVLNSEVIEHVPWGHKESFADDLKSLLAPGGIVILTTPRGEVWDAYTRIISHRQPIEDWMTEDQIRTLFRDRGFTAEGPERIWAVFPECVYFPNPTAAELADPRLMSIYQIWRFRLN
jgi:SAM-dependent methyltransferase